MLSISVSHKRGEYDPKEKVGRMIESVCAEASRQDTVSDGGNVAYMDYEATDKGARVNLKGKHAVFVEFGAGATVDPNPLAAQVPFTVARGSFSDTHEGPYKKSGYKQWKYNGAVLTHVMPKRPLFRAEEYIMAHFRGNR